MSVTQLSLSIIIVASMTGTLNAEETASFDGYQQIKGIQYAEVDGQRLLLDLYLPAAEKNPPLIVWVHGEAWRQGSKSQMPLTELVKSGFAVASVDYRLSPVAKFPAQIHDLKAALRFLRASEERWGIDTKSIGIAGASAGGHLAALVGVTNHHKELEGRVGDHLDQSSAVQAIVDYYGPTNFLTILSQSTPHGLSVRVPALELLLGGHPEKEPALARLASPVFHVDPEDPPLLLLHGDQDPQVPINQAHELHGKYKSRKLPVLFEVVHGGAHGGDAFFDEQRNAIVREFLIASVAGQGHNSKPTSRQADPREISLIQSMTKVTLRQNRNGQGTTWFHPRACMVPGDNGQPVALMTLQEIAGSDYFGPVHWTESRDGGKTWSDPQVIPSLGRIPVEGQPGLLAGVCDVVPEYHPQTGTVLALGHVVFYRGPRFAKGDQLARYPVYAVRRKDGTWSERKILRWDDPRGAHIYSNNCGQRVVLPSGEILMSFTFGPTENNRMVAGVKCSFDGEELKVLEVGPPLFNNVGRGLLEPSVTEFQGRYYLTIRAEDGRGYVAVSEDGLNYQSKTAWAYDDGNPLEMSTTQQHWLLHSGGLFLVYTRKDPSNLNVLRWRSPLWIAQVDPEKLCLIQSSETVVLPLVGDGVKMPDDVAIMGNFHVTNASPEESWVTVGEWMPRRNARGDLLLARIRWTRPNALAFQHAK